MEFTRGQRIYLGFLLGWLAFSSTAILLLNMPFPVGRARIGMAFGLIVLWVFICGGLMVRFREAIRNVVVSIRIDWRVRFVLFCTLLALIEEAISTSMTNTAPFYGLRLGAAYITASANYFDVILLHGVSLFVSFFVGWAVILWRYKFSPFSVFVLFGISGTLVEMAFDGLPHVLEFAMWSCVYGLMVWLPAWCIPTDRNAKPPSWWHYPLAVFVPFLFVFVFPLLGVISVFFPHHPVDHFR